LFSHILDSLVSFSTAFSGYAGPIAFGAAFLETVIGVGFLFPGSTLLLLMGVMAGRGVFDLQTLLVFAFLGALAGDNVNFYLGRRYGVALIQKPRLHLSSELIGRTERFLNSHGSMSVFFARFVPALKESMPFVAGSVKMRYGRFLFWDGFGAAGWSLEFIGIGYLFSASLKLAQLWLTRTGFLILILVLFLLALYLLTRYIYAKRLRIILFFRSLARAFMRTPPVSRWIGRHPKSVVFLKNRFSRSAFSGLTLTLLAVAFLYTAALFAGAVEDFVTKDPIVAVDHIIATAMPRFRTPELVSIFTMITMLGKSEVVALFFAIAVFLLWYHRKLLYVLPYTVTVAGSAVFTYLGKLAFHRVRPETALYVESTPAFPSGHAVIAITLYGFAAFLLLHFSESIRVKLNLFFWTFILAALIGFSRLYLGEHYLSDVYSGYLLGTLWLIIGIALTYWLESTRGQIAEPRLADKRIFAAAAAVFVLAFAGFSQVFHYRKVVPSVQKPIAVVSAEALFTDRSSRYVQSVVGLDAWPVNLVIAADGRAEITRAFKAAGWHEAAMKVIRLLPIFWSGRSAVLSFEKTAGKRRYFVKVFPADALLAGRKPLFVAVAGGIDRLKWDVVPVFFSDVDVARDYAVASLQTQGLLAQKRMIALEKPGIASDMMDEDYFSDGNAAVVILAPAKTSLLSSRPSTSGRSRKTSAGSSPFRR
jgi:membrane protein DedA with SNARE-associated domain/membrane-associated phospholipid phosphatase